MTGRSAPAARAMLARIVDRGWLVPRGRTRGRWYSPSDRLDGLPLRVPTLMRYLADGAQLNMFDDRTGYSENRSSRQGSASLW